MDTFVVLLLAHLVGDFPLQTDRIFKLKLAGKRGIALHVMIHVTVLALLLRQPLRQWLLLLALGGVHFLIDWTKLRWQRPQGPEAPGFLLDQVAHMASILLLALAFPAAAARLPLWLMTTAIGLTLVPAAMTFLWVWATDMVRSGKGSGDSAIVWACQKLLPLSQRVGWAILVAVMAVGLFVMW